MKRCSRCGEVKCLDDFHRFRGGHQSWCKPCRRSYDSAYHQTVKERRLEQKRVLHSRFDLWYAGLKTDKKCADCGNVYHPAAMHWHHLPGHLKEGNVADFAQRHNATRVTREIAKCELVCANCHAVRTWGRRANP